MNEGRAEDVIYLYFSHGLTFRYVSFKAFDIVSLNIGNLVKYRLDNWPVRWTE